MAYNSLKKVVNDENSFKSNQETIKLYIPGATKAVNKYVKATLAYKPDSFDFS